jgi:ABC-type dipeptide/oligopeptide/nickel transport system permease subunit
MKRIPLLTFFAGACVSFFLAVAIFAPWIAATSDSDSVFPLFKVGPETPDIFSAKYLAAPSAQHPFGTDYIGRDVLARLIYGLRSALFFAMSVVTICLSVGVILGGIMGFFGGKIDFILSRVMEIIGNYPIFLLQLTLLAFFTQGYGILLFVMILAGWIPYCRFTRAEFLKLRSLEFIQASQALGASRFRIFFKHLLPNSLTPILSYIPFDMTSTIIVLGALSFLGFGEPIDAPSIGELLKQANNYFRQAWWLAVFPGVTLFSLTLSLALFGSSIRDILDPRAQGR